MLESLLESWSRWVHQGSLTMQGTSIIGVMMDNGGLMGSGNKGGGSRPLLGCDSREAYVEALLVRLSLTKPDQVKALRLEYGAIWIKRLPSPATQSDKAHALNVSLRTYQNRLYFVKNYLSKYLTPNRR